MKILVNLFLLLLPAVNCMSTTFEVGPTKAYTAPSQVSSLVSDGDTVAIDAGTYIGDVATWMANDLVLMAVGNKRAHLRANGNSAQNKAIWVITGNNVSVMNMEFSECSVPDKNGAGIRQEGKHLTVRNCYFHDNENGILAGDHLGSNIIVEFSEFDNNGYGDGFSHNIYINHIGLFILQYCYMHHAKVGHNVKSRAAQNLIQYNRIMDESDGNASMLLDLPNGGESLVLGNLFHQGTNAINKRLLTYGLEGLNNPNQDLYVINNTFINDRNTGEFVVLQEGSNAQITNNIFAGTGTVLVGTATQATNVNVTDPATLHFEDIGNYHYRLTANSAMLIDAGSDPGSLGNLYLGPIREYYHLALYVPRSSIGALDIGAYEYNFPQPQITITGSEAICQGETTQLSISGTYRHTVWSNGAENVTSITVTQPGTYTVTATNWWNESGMASQFISIGDNCPTVNNEVRISEIDGVTSTNYPVQLARPFKRGEIAGYPQVLIDGNALLTQAQVQTRWEDGSVKHAILNFHIPQLDANSSVQITFQNQLDGKQSGYLNAAEMLDASYDFDGRIELINGDTLAVSAREMIENGDFAYWLKGEVATSVLLGDHSPTRFYDMGFDAEQSFRPLFYVTFWHASQEVDIRFVGEVSNTEHLQDMAFALNLYTGDSSPELRYSKANFTHHAMSRWTKRFWLDTEPSKVNTDHHLPYLVETTLVPNYDTSKVVSEAVINNNYSGPWYAWLQKDRDINESGNWTPYMPTTGGRPDIGPYPSWAVRWLYTGDWRMLEQTVGNADLAGAWPMHLREGNPLKFFDREFTISAMGKPISISDRPTFWFTRLDFQYTQTDDKVTPVGPHTNGGWTPDNAHQPDPYSLLYLLTGDYWYFEQLNFWTSFGAANHNGAFTTGTYGRGPTGAEGGISGQVRSQAWLFRTRAQAAMLAPDASPEKDYYTTLINDAIAIWEGEHNITNTPHYQSDNWNWGYDILGGDDVSPLNHWRRGNSNTATSSCLDLDKVCEAVAPWQYNFVLFALGHADALGFDSGRLRKWLGKHLVNVLTKPQYDPYRVANYREPTTKNDCSYFSSWSEMKDAYGPTCTDALTEFNNYQNDAEHGYTYIAMCATSFVSDLPHGPEAWSFMQPVLANSNLDDNPKWALQPALSIQGDCFPPNLTKFRVNNCHLPSVTLSWAAVPGALQYQFLLQETGSESLPTNRPITTTTSTFTFNENIFWDFDLVMQLRVQCVDGSWSDWRPLTPRMVNCSLVDINVVDEVPIHIAQFRSTAEAEILVFPNPAGDELKIQSLSANIEKIEVFTPSGVKVAMILPKGESSWTVDLSGWSTGIYFIQARGGAFSWSEHFVKIE